jgi:hypothetical protein
LLFPSIKQFLLYFLRREESKRVVNKTGHAE